MNSLAEPQQIGSGPRGRERGTIDVDPDDLAVRPDEFGSQKGHISHAAPDVEDALAGRDASFSEQAFGHRSDQRGLRGQSLVLDLRTPQRVRGVSLNGHGFPSFSQRGQSRSSTLSEMTGGAGSPGSPALRREENIAPRAGTTGANDFNPSGSATSSQMASNPPCRR